MSIHWFRRKPLALPYFTPPRTAGPLHFSADVHTAAELMASERHQPAA